MCLYNFDSEAIEYCNMALENILGEITFEAIESAMLQPKKKKNKVSEDEKNHQDKLPKELKKIISEILTMNFDNKGLDN